nr:hypothetical protein 12 [Desulfobulbaceae bacterium]
MKTITTLIAVITLVVISSNAFSSTCRVSNYNGRISYSGCSATEMRAIQAGQFRAKQAAKAVGQAQGEYKAKYRLADGKAKDFNFNEKQSWAKKKAQVDRNSIGRSYLTEYEDGSKTQHSVIRSLKKINGVYVNTYDVVTINKAADRSATDYMK